MSYEYSNLEKTRLEKVQRLQELGIEPFPNRAERSHTSHLFPRF